MEKKLTQAFPLWAVEDDWLISRKGDITIGFELQLPELFTLSAPEYTQLEQNWIKAVKLLPPGTILHKQDFFLERTFQASDQGCRSFLQQSSDAFFQGRPYLQHRCYVFLTQMARRAQVLPGYLMHSLIQPSFTARSKADEKQVRAFLSQIRQFKLVLESNSFLQLRLIQGSEYDSSATEPGILHRYLFLDSSPSVLKDIQIKESLRIGNQTLGVYSLANAKDWPSQIMSSRKLDRYSTESSDFVTGFVSPLGPLLTCSHVYNQYVCIEEAGRIIKTLEQKRLRLQALSSYSRENQLSRESIDAFLNEALARGSLPVRAHFNLMLWGPTQERLMQAREQAFSALSAMNILAKEETLGAAPLFWAGIPGNASDLPAEETFLMLVEPAVCLLNHEGSSRNNTQLPGVRLGERLTGKPLQIDLSEEPYNQGLITNYNKFILGPSGSGKSFFTNHLIRSYFDQGAHIVLVDVGHSYQGLCEMLKGSYFTYEEKASLSFNPFIPNDELQGYDLEKREFLKALLLSLWKKKREDHSQTEYSALSHALYSYLSWLKEHPYFRPCFNSFYEFVALDYKDPAADAEDRFLDWQSFLFVLRPFYEGGEFEYLLNASEQVDLLAQRFIVFELQRIRDHPLLFPVVTLMIMDVFWSKVRKLEGVRKMILLEEAWKSIAQETMATYIQTLFKTLRKHTGEAIVVTQEIEDIISSPIVKHTIINNSDCKIILDQSKQQHKFEQIQQLLGLTQKQKAQILSLNRANDPSRRYKEVFISLGAEWSNVFRVETSPQEYWCYTSKESEKLKRDTASQHYGSLQAGIQALVDSQSFQS